MRSPMASAATAAIAEDNARGPAAAATGARRKGAGIRAWLVVSSSGSARIEEFGKHSIMRRTGLPARDLRVLDPMLSYPSTILGRERAIVINLEKIKAVVIATEVLIPNPNPKDPQIASFVENLQFRISGAPHQALLSDDMKGELVAKTSAHHPLYDELYAATKQETGTSQENVTLSGSEKVEHIPQLADLQKEGDTKLLPFEFRALEACLECICRYLESEASTLELETYPALDELTSKISTLNLERVRQIKSRLVAISGRVQKVRDELEHLLDDDMDMAEMYLTEKLVRPSNDEALSRVEMEHEDDELGENGDEDSKTETESSHGNFTTGFKPNIEELEMLLEAYFVQIDGTLNKLSALNEYVDDTEDYINIMLDEKQNQLLQMGVMLSTATLVLTAGVVVVGVFGMNISIELFNAPYSTFWKTTFGTLGGCIFFYVVAILWGKKSGLLQ